MLLLVINKLKKFRFTVPSLILLVLASYRTITSGDSILLVGVCVWGVFGHLDTTLSVAAIAQEGTVTAYVREGDIAKVKAEAVVTVNGDIVKIWAIDDQPVQVDEAFSEYACHVGDLQQGEWVYAVKLDANYPDGVYTAQIVVDSVSPMSFVLN